MTSKTAKISRFAAASIIPAVFTTFTVYYGVTFVARYGWVMFIFVPTLMGFATGTIYSVGSKVPYWQTFLAGIGSILIVGLLVMLLAIEGLICLAMALPLTIPLNAIGTLLGWAAARLLVNKSAGPSLSILLFVLVPFMMGFENSSRSEPTVHTVVTTIEVDAPVSTVWKNVIEFPRIDAEPEGILGLGFAYPIDAKIDGEGVGAVRYCNFNTGPFVEPITAWQEPNLLAFDVAAQPSPMIETTPYAELHAAHLQYIRSRKGQFRLYERDGKTVLEGTTFYTHDIAPDAYWKLYSDEIIHKIHLRVLNHIKAVSEGR